MSRDPGHVSRVASLMETAPVGWSRFTMELRMGRIIIGTLGLTLAVSPVTGVFATADAATAVDGHASAVDERSAVAKAALAHLAIAETAQVDVLRSQSTATYDHAAGGSTSSAGSSSSDGAVANVGGESGLTIVVLHSQASSGDNGAGSYLLAVNDNKVGTSGDVNGAC